MSDRNDQATPSKGRTETVQLEPDLDLTVRTAGGGRPVLVLHGGAGPGSVAPIAAELSDRYMVVTPTHPGWEGTPRPARLEAVAELAATYAQLLEVLDLRGVILVGSSFGGWVAAEIALADDSHRVAGLVLLDPVGLPAAPHHRPSAPPGPGGGPGPAELALLTSYAGPTFSDSGLGQRLERVRVPVLVVWGEHDPLLTPAYGKTWADAFEHATFTVISGAGHLPSSEAPEPTFAAIDAFLGSLQVTGPETENSR